MSAGVRVIFDGPPGPEPGRFVEVENGDGESIRFGEWEERPSGGYWALALPLRVEYGFEFERFDAGWWPQLRGGYRTEEERDRALGCERDWYPERARGFRRVQRLVTEWETTGEAGRP